MEPNVYFLICLNVITYVFNPNMDVFFVVLILLGFGCLKKYFLFKIFTDIIKNWITWTGVNCQIFVSDGTLYFLYLGNNVPV